MNNIFKAQNQNNDKKPHRQRATLTEPHTIYMHDYPELLRQIPDPPKKLLLAGNTSLLQTDSKFLCIVGSRKYTDYGRSVCTSLIEGLQGYPIIIVLGLALGIDSIAHRSSLKYNIPTIAVPGSGLHPSVLYPKTHFPLAEEIIEHNGLILSEFNHTEMASPWTFPVRNRIMSALSHAVLIIEAEEDSGTLITSRLALDYNRDVYAVPGSIYSSTSIGPHNLIRRGAIPITCAKDVLDALGIQQNEIALTTTDDTIYSTCSKEEMAVIYLLNQPKTANEICEELQQPISKIQVIISMLEIRKLIKVELGNIYLTHHLPHLSKP